jgi:6-phosphogluconolactonase (cycloisomerase 2 family)
VVAGHSCTIKVTFSPTAIGTRSGQLMVSDSDSTSPQSVHLSGTGSATGLSALSVTPANPTIPLGRQQQFAATGYFKNGSSADLTTSVSWTSSAPTVATISNSTGSQGLATSAKQGTTNITAMLGPISGSTKLTVIPPVLVSLAVSPTNAAVTVGKTLPIAALGTFSDGTSQLITTSVSWGSSDNSIATVSQGLATGIAAGKALITASVGSLVASTSLTVNPVPSLVSITVSPQNALIFLGKTIQFLALGVFSDGSSQDLTASVTWLSSNSGFATISHESGSQGLATGVAQGTVTITASAQYLGLHNPPFGTATLIVQTPVVDSLSISQVNPSVQIADRLSLTAIGHLTDGSTKDVTKQVNWVSANSSVATVSDALAAPGVVTGITEGVATVTATIPFFSISASTSVTVTFQQPAAVSIRPATVSIPLGDAQQFTAIVTFADGNSLDWTPNVLWNSADPTVAAFGGSSLGRATSLGLGTTTVSALVGSVSGSAVLTVTPPVPGEGRFAYVANGADSTLSAYRIDGATGLLTSNGTISVGDGIYPGALATDPLHKFLYAGNLNNLSMSGFTIDPAAGTLSPLLNSPFSTQFPWAIAVHPSGKFLYVASGPGNVLVYSLDASGTPTFTSSQTDSITGGTIALAIDPLGKFVYTANVNANTVSAHSIDLSTGALAPVLGSPFAAGSNPFSVSVHPSGRFLFVPNVNGQNVSAYTIDSSSGALVPIPGSPFSVGQTPTYVALHPSGAFAYVLNQSSNTISAFTIDSTTGALSPIAGSPFTIADGVGPVAASVDPLGKALYVVNQSSNSISIFAIDATSGALSSRGSVQTGSNPLSIVLTQ